MLQEKKSETIAEKQKVILMRLISELTQQSPDLYYQSTNQIARIIDGYIKQGHNMNADEIELMKKLSSRDIEVMLSLH